LDEIVTEDVIECFSRLGLSPQYAGKDIPGLKVITALSLTFACAFNSFIDKGVQDWKSIFTLHRFVMNDLKHVENRKELSHGPLPVKAETDDELRNTLINATAEVIARSGLDGATLSRIARRARMTSGAVYTLYSTKDELIDDAITVLMSAARSDTTSLVQESQAVGDPFTSTMQVYSLAFEPSRRSLRRFRLETFTSARTDADIKSLVRGMYRQRMKEYDSMFGPDTSFSADFIRTVGRAGQMQPLGFSILEHFITTPENINMLPLSSAITRNIYNVLTHAN
jgi:AcrR family transcriptional regulator